MADIEIKRRIAFVTGGSGFVGGRLIRALVARGWDVRALARSSTSMAAVAALGARPVSGDIGNREALSAGLEGCDVVFHAAAMFKLWGTRREFDAVNVDGMDNLIAAAVAASSVRKLIYVSAAAVVMGDPVALVERRDRSDAAARLRALQQFKGRSRSAPAGRQQSPSGL